jgi:putative transposase
MRKLTFANEQYYHIYNRGTDKRPIFLDLNDLNRFLTSIVAFNSVEPIGSIFEYSLQKKVFGNSIPKLVDIIAYCLNPNHFHLILKQLIDKGIEKFMHRLSLGYTNYFNEKNKRSGVLFQGRYKAKHIETNEYLLHLSAYINLNYKVHGYIKTDLYQSSFGEYINHQMDNSICNKDMVLQQFKSTEEYIDFAYSSIQTTIELREEAEFGN